MRHILHALILFICLLAGCQSSLSPPPSPSKQPMIQSKEEGAKPHSSFHGVKDSKGRLNVLIVGIDSRGEQHSRSDAIMMAQYNPDTRKVKVVSIMRDCYVKIPGYSKIYNKINLAHFLGGPELLRQTIRQNFGLDAEHYITIDFQGFIRVVDMLAPGGIEVDVKQRMIDDMGLHLQPGRQKLHGKELLAYARFRHDAESDFGRVRRQQEVLQALKDTFSDETDSLGGMMKLPGIGQELLKYVESDMSTQTMLAIGGNILINSISSFETMRIPVNAGYIDKTYHHAGAVLELDFLKNREALKEFFIHDPTPVNESDS